VVALFMVFMILVFILTDYYLQQRRIKTVPAADAARRSLFHVPDGVYAGPGHLFSVLTEEGQLRIGPDPFLFNVFGGVDSVESPCPGANVRRGECLFEITRGDRVARIPAFADGSITDVNRPDSVDPDDFSASGLWMVEFRPHNMQHCLKKLRIGDDARKWMRSEIARFKSFLNQLSAGTDPLPHMQDGGWPISGVLDRFGTHAWDRFEREFLSNEAPEE